MRSQEKKSRGAYENQFQRGILREKKLFMLQYYTFDMWLKIDQHWNSIPYLLMSKMIMSTQPQKTNVV